MANKAYLSADALIAGVAGDAVDYEIRGLGWVQLRPLTFSEVQSLTRKHDGDQERVTIAMIAASLNEPKLTEDQVTRLEQAGAGYVTQLFEKVSFISGVDLDGLLEGEAGGGS